MRKVLWACWDGGGNLTPSLGIARALADRGCEVVFAGRRDMVGRVEADGLAAHELTQAYALLDRYAPHPQLPVFGYLSSPAVGEELLSVVASERPDAVVIDAMFGAALDVAARFGVPTVVMLHTFLRRMVAAWTANLKMQCDMRVGAGFAPLSGIDALWGGRTLLHVNTLDAFDGRGEDPWPNVRHGAPVLVEERRAAAVALPWPDDDPAPIVLVSFSTMEIQRSQRSLQAALDALAPLPVHVVLTTGGVLDPRELTAPANALVVPFASHEALMRRASLVVTHGGHGTAMRSLRRGLPMVVTPALSGDQPFVCAAIEEWGAGRALPRDPTAADIRSAVEAVLGDEQPRRKARELARQLEGPDGSELAAVAVAALVGG